MMADPLKIAIIGTAPSSRNLAPFGDLSWTIWGCSPGNIDIPRYDAWFEIHKPAYIKETQPDFYEALGTVKNAPIYMREQVADIPACVALPVQEYKQLYPHDFLSSSIAWMMAHAIAQEPEEIGLYGVDMACEGEYADQRDGILFFKWVAESRGIKVTIPVQSDLFITRQCYGVDDPSPMKKKLLARQKELKARTSKASAQKNALATEETYVNGALEDIEYMLRTFT